MTTFQWIALPMLLALTVATAVSIARHRVTARAGVGWLALWLGAASAIAFPEMLVSLAHVLGIGRGADLVLYLSILFTFVALFTIYLRFRRMDEQITTLVRHLAIREAEGRNDGQ